MIKKLTAVVGFGAGYVLGTKAGQERYRQIKALYDDLRGRPEVQKATETLQSAASDLADKATSKAKETVHDTVDKVTHKQVDLTQKVPMEGAAPSGSTL
jgi:hypothetical protein